MRYDEDIFGTRFIGSYLSDLHQFWYAYALYESPRQFFLIRTRSNFIAFLPIL